MSGQSWRVPFLDLAGMHEPLRADLDAVWTDVVDRTAFIGGDLAAEFERRWAEYCGVEFCIGVANGTDSIELILRALDIGPGDEVIVPANTFIATAEAAVACGATPVYVDVDPDTLLIGPDQIAAAITPKTKAVIPVHLYGQPCDMDAVDAVARHHGVAVIEDAAQAHGARWRDRPVGSFGTAACFSFYPGKNLGAFGDAGAVVTDDPSLAATVRSLANHGRVEDPTDHPRLGRNSRLDALQAGVLLVKLGHLDRWNERRRAARRRFQDRLAATAAVPVVEHPDAWGVHHLNIVQVPDRDDVLKRLTDRGVEARIHYPIPCHLHVAPAPDLAPALDLVAAAETVPPPSLPVSEAAAERILSLPMHPMIEDHEIDLVCDALASILIDLGHGDHP